MYLPTAVTMGHVVAVFYRSHFNEKVLQMHRAKILFVPPLFIFALALSFDFLMLAAVVMLFWQTYHYALQHFGLIRIYHSKVGNFSKLQLKLDILACITFVFFPILAGTSKFMLAFDRFFYLQNTVFSFFLPHMLAVAEFLDRNKSIWMYLHFLLAALYFGFTIFLGVKNRKVSAQKIGFMAQLFAVFSLGFLFFQPIIGILALDLLHSIQYYGLLSLSERNTTAKFLKTGP